tara:strand:+ start:4129 stop:4857 length:729 start_codon:yes stop_codon:yes gene_type:complete
MKLRKIKVYGRLRQFLGKPYFEAVVNNPLQAFSFLINNFPEVENHINNQIYKVKMGDLEITEDILQMNGDGDIKIIPIAIGSAPAIPIIGGLITAGAGVAIASSSAAIFTTAILGTTVGALVGGGLIAAGASMAISGVSRLIAPTPTIPVVPATPAYSPAAVDVGGGVRGSSGGGGGGGEGSAPSLSPLDPSLPSVQANFGFSSISNTTRAGVPVPIIYGLVFSGSVVISSGVDTVQVKGTA